MKKVILFLVVILYANAIGQNTKYSADAIQSTEENIVLFFTEYVEGSSNNKAVEIGSKSDVIVDFSIGDFKVEVYSNGSPNPSGTIKLTGSISPNGVYILTNSSAATTLKNKANQTSGSLTFNGDDAVVLKNGTTILDVIGQIGFDPGSCWGSGDITTVNHTLRRKTSVTSGDTDGSDPFDPTIEWDGFAIDDFSDIGSAELPVELTAFNASMVEGKVSLNWETATEQNNYGFEVERQVNSEWNKIGFVEGNGNSNSVKVYSFTDSKPVEGKIVYRLKQIDFDGKYEYSNEIEVSYESVKEFSLDQNYPNPFNPTTNISFKIAESGKVSVKIFNAIGQEVAELVNKTMEAGRHEVSFNASNLPSGTYFCTMKAGSFTKTSKMLLIK